MKRTLMIALFAAVMTSFAAMAFADPATPRVDQRQWNQRARIHQGVANGQITPAERARLNAGQRHVHRMERRAKRDGVVTRGERYRINRAQNHQSRMIWRKKHNGRGC